MVDISVSLSDFDALLRESSSAGKENIPHPESEIVQACLVRQSMDKQLGEFLRKQRGEMTYAQFSRKVGLPASTLFRLEHGEQSLTLGRLQQILERLKCSLTDVFPDR